MILKKVMQATSLAFLSTALLHCAVAQQASDQAHTSTAIKYRKNIDELTPNELAAFEHAIRVLKERSKANVFDRTGFIWQAWIHNCSKIEVLKGRKATLSTQDLSEALSNAALDSCEIRNVLKKVPATAKTHFESPGECEHQKNTFLQWHRAQLYFFEKILQATDPKGKTGPSTKDVSLPYWNFTKKPSGKRFPKAFENRLSPLYDSTRTEAQLPSSLPTTSPYLLAYLIYTQKWDDFGGNLYGGGSLEGKIHNQMHATYVGGNMGDNQTAGLDPLFYVFHTFIDYSFEEWIKKHGADQISGNGRSGYMRAEQDATLPKPPGFDSGQTKQRDESAPYLPNMGQAQLYFDTKKLGYAFQHGKDGEFIPEAEISNLITAREADVFGDADISLFSALLSYGSSGAVAEPQAILENNYTVPSQPAVALFLSFSRKSVKADYSFQADVYLHPKNVASNIADPAFRNRYLVTNTAHWRLTGEHSGHSKIGLNVDVTGIIKSLVPKKQGEEWQITVGISGSGSGGSAIKASDFSPPVIASKP